MHVIETERLYLRELVPADKKRLARVLSDPESMRFYPKPFREDQVEEWILGNMARYRNDHHGLWAVILKKGGVLIGDCGITMQDIDGETEPEIGFHIIKEYCNNGYATEAALACKEYAFNVLNYPRIFSYCAAQNLPSQRVAEKIGMRFYKYFERSGEKQLVHAADNPAAAVNGCTNDR